jgi:hypothetical protein
VAKGGGGVSGTKRAILQQVESRISLEKAMVSNETRTK